MPRILDAASIIARLSTHTNVAVTRHASAPTYPGGIANIGAPTTFTIASATVWPANGRDLERLPEGRRSTETRNFASAVQLLVGAENGPEADLINLDGNGTLWEVQTSAEWDAASGYWLSLIQRPA